MKPKRSTEIKKAYYTELKKKSTDIMLYLCTSGTLIVTLLITADILLTDAHSVILLRLLALIPCIIVCFGLFIFPGFIKRYVYVFHGFLLFGFMIMSGSVLYLTMVITGYNLFYLMTSITIFMTTMFAVFCLSAGLLKIAPIITGVPLFLFLIALIHSRIRESGYGLTGNEIYFFLTLIFLWGSTSIAAMLFEYNRYQYCRKHILNNLRLKRLFDELTDLKQTEKKLERFASLDELTAVYNRRAGLEILRQALARCERDNRALTLGFVDVDDLKKVNDNFGHKEGDHYLQQTVKILRYHLRKGDSICRIGGDEFIVVLYGCSKIQAEEIFQRIDSHLKALNKQRAENTYSLGLSYGLAESTPDKKMDPDELLVEGDRLMYLAKQHK